MPSCRVQHDCWDRCATQTSDNAETIQFSTNDHGRSGIDHDGYEARESSRIPINDTKSFCFDFRGADTNARLRDALMNGRVRVNLATRFVPESRENEQKSPGMRFEIPAPAEGL